MVSMRPLSRRATPFIKPDIRRTEIITCYQILPLKRGQPFYKVIFLLLQKGRSCKMGTTVCSGEPTFFGP